MFDDREPTASRTVHPAHDDLARTGDPDLAQSRCRSENLLHEAEFLTALATIRTGGEHPHEELRELREQIRAGTTSPLAPGTMPTGAPREAEPAWSEVAARAEALIEASLAALTTTDDPPPGRPSTGGTAPTDPSADAAEPGHPSADAAASAGPAAEGTGPPGPTDGADDEPVPPEVLVNTAPVPRRGVPAYGAAVPHGGREAVVVFREATRLTVENEHLRTVLDESGAMTSLVDRAGGHELIAPGHRAAQLQLGRPRPADADDPEADEPSPHLPRDLDAPTAIEVSETGGGVRIAVTYTTVPEVRPETTAAGPGASAEASGHPGAAPGRAPSITATYELHPGDESLQIVHDIDGRDRTQDLTLAFPLDLRADRLSSESRLGPVDPPAPPEASQGPDRPETRAHRWLHATDGERGVALATDAAVDRELLSTERPGDGGTTTTIRLTLPRSSTAADPDADHGTHRVRAAIRPGASLRAAIAEGHRLARPERRAPAAVATAIGEPLLTLDAPSVLVETIKLAEDRSGDLVAHLYEAEGERITVTVTPDAMLTGGEVGLVDRLERPIGQDAPAGPSDLEREEGGGVRLRFRPFEAKTLRISRPR